MALLFLDRDGVINRFPGKGKYVTTLDAMHISKQALRGIAALSRAGYRIAVISNQGCVSRKLVTKKQLSVITQKMKSAVSAKGGKIWKVFYCFHQTSDGCACKKPKTLLLEKAHQAFRGNTPIKSIYFIGDSREDIEAGLAYGCKTVLVLSGRTKRREIRAFTPKPDAVKKNLEEAAKWILRLKK